MIPCSEPHSSIVSPSHQSGGGGSGSGGSHVNFRSIEELSRSDRQPEMEVDPRNPQIAKVINLIRSSRENATFSGRHSPQPARGASPSSSPINSLQRCGETQLVCDTHSPFLHPLKTQWYIHVYTMYILSCCCDWANL